MISGLEILRKKECVTLLKDVAQMQYRLFLKHFNWKEKELRVSQRKRGFFKRKTKEDEEYGQLLQPIEHVRNELRTVYGLGNDKEDMLWWNLPWEHVEPYLIYHLREEASIGKWRYRYQWEMFGNEELKVLTLCEEGHFTDFTSNVYQYKKNESAYSLSEQEEIVHSFNKELDKQKKREILFDDDTPVKTELGNIYDSVTDYYDSWEYHADREFANNILARSLYTEHTTQINTVVSNSRHYKCVFEVGAFHFNYKKELDGLSWHPFELKAGYGDMPKDLRGKYEGRDAAIVCAAFIRDQDWIQRVPIALFGMGLAEQANSMEQARQRAGIFTCLADKLV